jgi:flagellar assembly factor FliW
MEVRTTRLGPLETLTVPDTALLEFPRGLPGFEQYTRFALIEDPYYAPFGWLQALDDPYVKFLVVPPAAIVPDYQPRLHDQDLSALELADPALADLLCILVVPGDVRAMTANLRAPIVLNRRRQRAQQVILTDDRYPLRHPVFAGTPASQEVRVC